MNLAKPISYEDGMAILPTVLFTEDDWNTVHTGCCIDSTFYSYLVRGCNYGTFWIPKCYVKIKDEK